MSFRSSLMLYRSITGVVDVGTALLAWVLGGYLRYGELWLPKRELFRVAPGWVLAVYAALLVLVLYTFGAYRSDRLRQFRTEILSSGQAVVVLGVLVYASVAIFKLHGVSRLLLGCVMVTQALLTFLSRVALRRVLTLWLERWGNPSRILLVGFGPSAEDLLGHIRTHRELNADVIGYLGEPGDPPPFDMGDELRPPRLGDVSDISSILQEQVVDEVIVALPFLERSAQDVVRACQREGKPVHFPLSALSSRFAYSHISCIEGITVLSLSGAAHGSGARALKRLIDLVGATVGLILLSPVLLAIAALIALTSPGPVFFKQERVGLNGRRFHIWKFRTMVSEAESMKAALEHLNEAEGPVFKIKNDPRITPIGRFLRRTSLDELPQLINVVKGDMSLVGPRPLPTGEARECCEWHRRHSVRPGMTGPWQVNGRHRLGFNEWMEMDLSYVDNWSILLDLKILLKTIPEVLGLGGA